MLNSKIDMIKVFRNITGLGLVEAKFAVEEWERANPVGIGDSYARLESFIHFTEAFAAGEVKIAGGAGTEYKIVWNKSLALCQEDIYTLGYRFHSRCR